MEPFQVTAISSRVIAIVYGFIATVLVNTCAPGPPAGSRRHALAACISAPLISPPRLTPDAA